MDQDKPGEMFACNNTDRELFREIDKDYYSASVHVTADGRIGMNVGGSVFVAPIREWHAVLKTFSEEKKRQ